MEKRRLQKLIQAQLDRGKSVLLLGPRQVGKTTLAKQFQFDLEINLAKFSDRLELEKNPDLLGKRIESLQKPKLSQPPLVFIDEVQLVPALLSEIQVLIDQNAARFLLTGSSARKLRREAESNLIPGRVVNLRLDPFSVEEYSQPFNDILLYGQLPEISLTKSRDQKNLLLTSYVENYIEDEIRKETKIRNVANYSRFLELAAIQSGEISNFSEISKELGPTVMTIQSYYQVLEDTLFAELIDPYLKNATRKKLTKASRYLFYDLGVRRITAREGSRLLSDRRGKLFEHWIGNELIKWIRARALPARLHFWRDPDGPKVDWLLDVDGRLLPIEVKMTKAIRDRDVRHLRVFLSEYPDAEQALVVTSTDLWFDFDAQIQVVGHMHLHHHLDQLFLK